MPRPRRWMVRYTCTFPALGIVHHTLELAVCVVGFPEFRRKLALPALTHAVLQGAPGSLLPQGLITDDVEAIPGKGKPT